MVIISTGIARQLCSLTSLKRVIWSVFFFFFFQAEDGIRDDLVTGVQTCALPISLGRLGGAQRAHAHEYEELGLLDKVFILVGVGPLRSAKAAEWIRTHVPGVHIPDEIIRRLAGASDGALEGRKLCIELIQEIRTITGVHGVHVMAYRQEETVAEIIERSGVLGGRVPWYPGRDPQTNTNRMAS